MLIPNTQVMKHEGDFGGQNSNSMTLNNEVRARRGRFRLAGATGPGGLQGWLGWPNSLAHTRQQPSASLKLRRLNLARPNAAAPASLRR